MTVSIHDLYSPSHQANQMQTWNRALLQDFWTIYLAINNEICFKHMRFFTNTSTTLTIGQAHSQFVATLGQQAILEVGQFQGDQQTLFKIGTELWQKKTIYWGIAYLDSASIQEYWSWCYYFVSSNSSLAISFGIWPHHWSTGLNLDQILECPTSRHLKSCNPLEWCISHNDCGQPTPLLTGTPSVG